MTVSFEIVEDPARVCAALMVGAAIGGGDIVLTGGSTPRAAYQHFVEAVQRVDIDLSLSTFWIGDERCVDPEDDRANYKMIKENLLDPLGDRAPRFMRIKGELGPDEGAEDYEEMLKSAGTPKFDLLLLGIGSDGHCASLFPGQKSLTERHRLVVGVPQAGLEPFVPRISMTLPVLAAAHQIAFLAVGDSKADAIARAFGPDAEPDPSTPSSLLVPEAKAITVLVDEAAAARLSFTGEPQ
ncbi:MAG TPA: 6-phosphogluconolactonase [Solirubrobacteraceae bacterium]|jgi:6-phosphogluconolactonase|nr:6-phosphogluconolactonase [Solirubrobacteraceae bacterium]